MNDNREEILIEKARNGDPSAFAELLQLHRGRLESWIRGRVGARLRNKVEVDDVIQETHLRSLQSIKKFSWRGEDSFYKWLCAIAEHLLWNASQKRSTGELRLMADVQKSTVSPSRLVRRNERFDRLENSLKKLRAEEQEVLRLSRIEGLKIREIADRMQKTESAVKSLIARSLRKVRDSFGDTESLHLPPRELSTGETGHEG